MEHILTGLYNKPTNNSRRPPRGAYNDARPPASISAFTRSLCSGRAQ
ncbi:MAG: hypothetical protein ACMX3H_04705 [Sodalis sp. (in: enterobacteria)]